MQSSVGLKVLDLNFSRLWLSRKNGDLPAEARSRFKAGEIALLVLLTNLLFAGTILCFRRYQSAVNGFGDSGAYTEVASAIRQWNFTGLQVKQFWGYPYAMAAVSAVTRISDQNSLLLVSFASSFLSIALAYKLWGGWIAGLFAVLNFDWMQRSYLGGSEPLFIALLFASFLAVRRERWILAACF